MKKQTIQALSIALFALLLVFGGYSLIVYLGVTYHGAAMIPDATINAIVSMCGESAYVCKGFNVLEPFLLNTVVRAAPFLGVPSSPLLPF